MSLFFIAVYIVQQSLTLMLAFGAFVAVVIIVWPVGELHGTLPMAHLAAHVVRAHCRWSTLFFIAAGLLAFVWRHLARCMCLARSMSYLTLGAMVHQPGALQHLLGLSLQ